MTCVTGCLTLRNMNDNNDTKPTALETSTEKRPWQPPTMEVFDVASSTLLSPAYNYAPDGGLYVSL